MHCADLTRHFGSNSFNRFMPSAVIFDRLTSSWVSTFNFAKPEMLSRLTADSI
jgi:hypothetical protein